MIHPCITIACTRDLLMELYLWVISKYPENAVVTFDSRDNERGCPFFVSRVDLCTVVDQHLRCFVLVTGYITCMYNDPVPTAVQLDLPIGTQVKRLISIFILCNKQVTKY